ncbi:D-2-hydroxyacid dehydrogenase family protein [Marinomonas spartinae]|uniref:D-2-hydroxyacid dehydrogenase family protein n=1 Tax=Marinomonas spartinae TaxID=1792290 RepID=UPI0018F22188|nr:D-2-hydroxyacid dehydrogenase family protein [Marinomonas spartinae]MBJ7552991.1 D-2-hydroxyacid dehydrogenase family protein [Marinomonas spartinae]
MKIAIMDDYQNVIKDLNCMSLLVEHEVMIVSDILTQEEKIQALDSVDGVVLIRERTQINEAFLSALPNLKVISQTGKISHHIDVEACQRHGVTILEGVGSPVAPAELCWALVMAASRHIVPYASGLKEGKWQAAGSLGLGRVLDGLVFGIWGFGKIGQRVARYATAFGMKVMVWGSESSRQKAEEMGYLAAESKQAFFAQADVLSLHLRLNEATTGVVTQADLSLMKPDSLFVNISRAELVEHGALLASLGSGHPGFAAVDVFEQEPILGAADPLLSLQNVLATPHIGYVEKQSYELYCRVAFENIVRFFTS